MEEPDERLLSDAALIDASLREPSSFAALFDRHADEILRYCQARVGRDLAEDVTAETFLAAFRQRAMYDLTRSDARPWLYGIAIRQDGTHRRAEARQRRLLGMASRDPGTPDPGERSAERISAQRLQPKLTAVLGELRRQDRELLLLVAWAGLSYSECAEALGITVSAVKARLNRIRVRTRKALGGVNPLNEEIGNG